LHLLK